VAGKITDYLKSTDRFAKTIVFCETTEHAERMRQALVNVNSDLAAANSKYVMRITGDDDEGKAQLDNFIDPESTYPVIACTSRLMSTGVDAQTCQLIVLDKNIASMTEFKQIIGRGTRINEDYNKFYFTIMDFRGATKLFADPEFDGDPEQIYEPEKPGTGEPEVEYDPDGGNEGGGEGGTEQQPGRTKYYVNNVEVTVAIEMVQYLNEHGQLITESLTDYTRKTILQTYSSLSEFLSSWNHAERKQVLIDELAAQGVFLEELAEKVGRDYDPFDLICHIAFDATPLTRSERANRVKKRDVFAQFGEQARVVLASLLDKYADSGITSVESMDILKVDPLRSFGTPMEIVNLFGGKSGYLSAIHELGKALYQDAA
jgi:type I restriction enzyme R subunit